jgi:CRP/FNR family cyclic AMP-dependent transcriptional regulator
LNKDEARQIVLGQGWLSHTPASFQSAVIERCRLEQFVAGTPVYAVGDEPGGMFGIISGGLGLSVATAKRGAYTAHFAMPGSWFGEAAAFTRQPRRVGLIATRDTVLLHLPLQGIDEIVRRDPAAWRFFGLLTLDHLNLAMGGSDDLMIRNHVKRFVAVLLRVGNCRGVSPQDDHRIEIDINHEDLAYLANVARTTAGGILRKLEGDGHVTLAYRRICILSPSALKKMLQD